MPVVNLIGGAPNFGDDQNKSEVITKLQSS